MKTFLLLLAFCFSVCLCYGQTPTFEWAQSVGGPKSGTELGTTIKTDALGNVYTAGYFQGTVDFDPGAGEFSLTSAGNYDAFLVKLDATGSFLWAKRIGGKGDDRIQSMDIDAMGNAYIFANFLDTITVTPNDANLRLISNGGFDMVFAKVTPSGECEWMKQIGGGNSEYASDITVVNGFVYLTGGFEYIVDFDPNAGQELLRALKEDIFIAKFTDAGDFRWVKQFGDSANYDRGRALTVDQEGNIYATGYFLSDTVDFDPGAGTRTIISAGNGDCFILKLNMNGDLMWAHHIGGGMQDEGESLKLDKQGNIYIGGYFTGTADVDPGAGTVAMTSNGRRDIFLIKLDKNGSYLWADQIGSSADDYARELAVDGNGEVYATGSFAGTVDFDPGPGSILFTAPGSQNLPDIYIIKLHNDGTLAWAHRTGGTGLDQGSGITVDKQGNVFTTGTFTGSVDFDPGTAVSTLIGGTGADCFVQKLRQEGFTTSIDSEEFQGDKRHVIYRLSSQRMIIDLPPGKGSDETSLSLYSLQGIKVYQENTHETQNILLDCTHLATGSYILHIHNTTITENIIITLVQ